MVCSGLNRVELELKVCLPARTSTGADAAAFLVSTFKSKLFPPSYYVRQSDKHELAKILNDPTNEILRYLESQNNTVDSKEAGGTDERTKTVPKRKSQSSGKRKTGVYGNLSSSLTDNNSGNSSPTQSKRAKH